MFLPSFIDVGITIAILEQVEVISEFSWKWRIWRVIFSNLVSDRVYNFVYGWKGHIFKYLNPKKGTVLPSHNGDTATERKPIPRTLEGAIYVLQKPLEREIWHGYVQLWDKDTVRFKYKTEFIWESYGSFRLFRGQFFKNLRDFWWSRFQIWILSMKMAFWRAGYTSQIKEHLLDYLEEFIRSL